VQTLPTTTADRLRPHVPFLVLAALVFVLGLLESSAMGRVSASTLGAMVTVAFAVATAVSRALPGAALGIVWAVGMLQLAGGLQVMFVQLAVAVVAFGCARWGGPATLWISGASFVVAAALVVVVGAGPFRALTDAAGLDGIIQVAVDVGLPWRIVMGLVALTVFGLPWLIGLALRSSARARQSDASTAAAREEVARVTLEARQAAEIARLQEERTQLALDVHDVVGHSLAVILAQAESAQFLPDDSARLKQTIATIATSARSSLQDVRHVLGGSGPAPRPLEVDVLLESARAAGFSVDDRESGEPHPLPPERQTVAHRVLQEMITNAIRHGSRASPIRVARRWPAPGERDLIIEVSNSTESPVELDRDGARGLEGMRRRLESAGGTLELRPPSRRGGRFTAVATMPVRAEGGPDDG
jgi:signal transduction histidine kinase